MSDEQNIQQPNVIKELWEKIPYIYVNTTQIQSSNWDIRILFSERLPNDTVEPRAAIVLSPQHAKAFLEALVKNVAKFEVMFGSINYTPREVEKKG